jgi:hypothetical protein
MSWIRSSVSLSDASSFPPFRNWMTLAEKHAVDRKIWFCPDQLENVSTISWLVLALRTKIQMYSREK